MTSTFLGKAEDTHEDKDEKVEDDCLDEIHRPQRFTDPSEPSFENKNRHTDPMAANTTNDTFKKKDRRPTCTRCRRVIPQACICEALPTTPIELQTTEILVLQHPLEVKQHKSTSNRTVPILELCLSPRCLHLCIGRRLGTYSVPENILQKLQNAQEYISVLVFPKLRTNTRGNTATEQIFSLNKLIKKIQSENNHTQEDFDATSCNNDSAISTEHTMKKKILLIVLDATWKYAREMHIANQEYQQYPSHMLQISLEKEDLATNNGIEFRPRRFEIRGIVSAKGGKRAPTEEDTNTTWMSTGECIAWIVSLLENDLNKQKNENLDIYETLMKPLDMMVMKWRNFIQTPKNRKHDFQRGISKKGKRKRQH